MPTHVQVYTVDVGLRHSFECTAEESILGAMERAGRVAIPVGCRRGGCGACRVRITDGEFTASKMSVRYVSATELASGIVLACCVRPLSNLAIELAPSPKCAMKFSGSI